MTAIASKIIEAVSTETSVKAGIRVTLVCVNFTVQATVAWLTVADNHVRFGVNVAGATIQTDVILTFRMNSYFVFAISTGESRAAVTGEIAHFVRDAGCGVFT